MDNSTPAGNAGIRPDQQLDPVVLSILQEKSMLELARELAFYRPLYQKFESVKRENKKLRTRLLYLTEEIKVCDRNPWQERRLTTRIGPRERMRAEDVE